MLFRLSLTVVLVGLASISRMSAAENFIRGDADMNGELQITDAIRTLNFLFVGVPRSLACEDAADVQDSGLVDIADPVYTLNFLFAAGGRPPAQPYPECGRDPSADSLPCERFDFCPQGPPSSPNIDPPNSPTREPSILLRGKAEPDYSVRVVGAVEPLETTASADGSFELTVALLPNRRNHLSVTQRSPGGISSAPSAVSITHDEEAPELFVDLPLDLSTTFAESATVTGRVADRLSGFLGLEVTVAGEPAAVIVGLGTNGTFERASVPLTLGDNVLSVSASDVLGNSTTREITVTRSEPDPTLSVLVLISGNNQQGTAGQSLPEALTCEARRADGSPLTQKLLDFRVVRSDGQLAATQGGALSRILQVRTDDQGRAAAFLRLGTDAGCGNNRLEVSGTGLAAPLTFCASAQPGPAAQINVGSGNQQVIESGAPAPEPLRVRVSDGCNGVEGVAVTFRVLDGGGQMNELGELTVATTRTGHAEVQFTAGTAGPQLVEANFTGNLSEPAFFSLRALARDRDSTSFAGVVLDNGERTVGGARVSLEFPGEEPLLTETSSDGRFLIESIPHSGAAHLMVDASVSTVLGGETIELGTLPSLAFEVVVVPEARNSLPVPVYLPLLDPQNSVLYDGSVDVVLTVAGVEGVEMSVRAGSVTRADGSVPSAEDPVTLSLNQVHFDDIPMPLPDGAAPPFAWTLQPAGTHFDPPVAISFPNMSGLDPGAAVYFMSFDHDTAQFEIVASGQVSDDGATITSDPGVGIRKAGWGGNCPPYMVTGDAGNCLNVTAEKLVGGVVFDGDYLCKNQAEKIRFTAHYDPEPEPDEDDCGDGQPVWTIAPPEAGTFEGGVNTGDEVVFVQADDFVSSEADDVLLTASRGNIDAFFHLTVFEINSSSGVLAKTGHTGEFRSDFAPVGSEAVRIANLMNDFIFLAGFRTRTYSAAATTDAAVLAQAEVTGVVQHVEFFTKPGSPDPELWVRVTPDANTEDVFVTFEDGGELFHREHMAVVDLEIELNDTSDENDDVVRIKNDVANSRPKIDGRARLTSNPQNDVTIVLSNPESRLRFPEATDTTKELTLPKNGDWAPFEFSGESQSVAKDDAVIKVHLDDVNRMPDWEEDATVFWFDAVSIRVTTGGTYALSPTQNAYIVAGGHAADFEAKATIKPDGLDCSVDQITFLRLGIAQNVTTANVGLDFNMPSVNWEPGFPGTEMICVNKNVGLTLSLPSSTVVNDSRPNAAPLYDRPGAGDTLDPNSTKPFTCAGNAATVTSFDTPSIETKTQTDGAMRFNTAGTHIGTVFWQFEKAHIDISFRIWAVCFDVIANDVVPLSETTWELDVDSSRTTPQKATPSPDGGATPTNMPIVSPPFYNDEIQKPANQSETATGPTQCFQ